MSSRADNVRSIALGALSGVLLSAARAPLGIDWVSIPAVDGREAAGFASVALVAIAGWMALCRSARPVALLSGTFVGFALHGLVLANWIVLGGWISLAVFVAFASFVAYAIARLGTNETPSETNAGALECAGLAIASFGACWAMLSISRPLALLGAGLPQDDGVFASVFLLLAAFGAAAFGTAIAKGARARLALPILFVFACAVCFEPLNALARFSEHAGLEEFFRSAPWRLNLVHIGMLSGDALLAARVFVLPAFVVGAALACARSPRLLAFAALGIAFARAGWPVLVDAQSASTPDAIALLAAQRIVIATTIAAFGALLAILRAGDLAAPGRAIGVASCALALAAVYLLPRPKVLPLSPWEVAPPRVLWLRDSAEGLLTVELARDGTKIATLDRHRLTPSHVEQPIDAACFEAAAATHALLVGPLTTERVATLGRLHSERIDRTATFWRSIPQMELADAAPNPWSLPRFSEVTPPREVEDAIHNEIFRASFVITFAATNTAPLVDTSVFEYGAPTLVAWLDGAAEIADHDWGPRVALVCDGERLRVGVTNCAELSDSRVRFHPPGWMATFPAGEPLPSRAPLASLTSTSEERARQNLARTAERLARAARGTQGNDLLAGLARHFAAQVESSPFETAAQQVELDEEALVLIRDATLTGDRGSFERDLWNGLARILVEKRDAERIERHLKPLADRFAPWPELERALGAGDIEMLEYESAAQHFAAALANDADDVDLRVVRARTLVLAGRAADAVVELERAVGLAPARRDLARELAMTQVRAGLAEGKAAVEAMLREDPADSELRRFLEPGSLPPPTAPFARAAERPDH